MKYSISPVQLLPLLLTLLLPLTSIAAEQPQIVCIQCHSAMPGKLGEPVKLWQGSIHAASGIACNGCHGGDPADAANAMSPAKGFLGAPKEKAIPDFCGRCHVGVKGNFMASAHGRALGKGGPTCVTCHSNHKVVKASLELINEKSCNRCHSFERAQLLKSAMQEAEAMIAAIDNKINSYKAIGAEVDSLEKGLFASRNRFRALFHNVNVGMVKKDTAQIKIELKKIESVLQGLEESHRKRKIAGSFVVAGLLMAAALLYLLKKTYE